MSIHLIKEREENGAFCTWNIRMRGIQWLWNIMLSWSDFNKESGNLSVEFSVFAKKHDCAIE